MTELCATQLQQLHSEEHTCSWRSLLNSECQNVEVLNVLKGHYVCKKKYPTLSGRPDGGCTDKICKKKKSHITKDYPGCHNLLSHYTSHKETTECASLFGSHCAASFHLLKDMAEIKPRPKIGQKLVQRYCLVASLQERWHKILLHCGWISGNHV